MFGGGASYLEVIAMAVDANRMLRRYLSGVQNAPDRYVEGMQAPRRDPQQAALAAEGKWASNTQQAIQDRRFGAGVRSADFRAGVQAAISDGGQAYVSGVSRREQKVSTAFGRLAPLLDGVSRQVQAMPQDTEQQRDQRALAAIRMMRQVKRQYRGGGGGTHIGA